MHKSTIIILFLLLPSLCRAGAPDPEKWEKATVPGAIRKKAFHKFFRRWRSKLKCVSNEHGENFPKISRDKLTNNDVTIQPPSFRSKDGSYVVGVRVKVPTCNSYREELYNIPHWYFIPAQGDAIHIIPESGQGRIEPVEAGDFNGDGKTEWRFKSWFRDPPINVVFEDQFTKTYLEK